MNIELALLKLFSSYENYTNYIDRLKDNPLSLESQWVLGKYKSWYESKSVDIDFTTFKDYCFYGVANELDETKRNIYATLIDRVAVLDSDVPHDIIRKFQVVDKAEDLIALLEEVSSGHTDCKSLAEELTNAAEFFSIDSDTEYELLGIDREEETEENCYYTPWALDILNQCSAGLTGGAFILVMGRSNSGKTSLVVQETCNRYVQLFKAGKNPGPVLWINNEESFVKSIENRIFSYLTNEPTSVISKDVGKKNTLRQKINNGLGNVYQCLEDGKVRVTPELVAKVVDDIKPSAIVFNNLDKLSDRSSDKAHTQLGNLYRWARNLAISRDVPVFAVCQASADAQNKSVIFQTMAQDSKTDKAGEVDMMIGIGAVLDKDTLEEEVIDGAVTRFINVCKNKLPEGTVEEMREVYGRPTSFYFRTGAFKSEARVYD